MVTGTRRKLTEEEIADAERLVTAWDAYRRNNTGATQLWLAHVTGLGTQGSVSHYLRGTIPLNHKALLAICDAIGANPSTISPTLSRTLPKPLHNPNLSFQHDVISTGAKIQKVPLLSNQQMTKLSGMPNPYPFDAGMSFECVNNEFSPWLFAVEMPDESMMPEFRLHDRMLIDPHLEPAPGDYVIAKSDGKDEVVFRKYKYRGKDQQGNDTFDLVPLNDDYPTLRNDAQNITLIGVLVEHRKKYKVRVKK